MNSSTPLLTKETWHERFFSDGWRTASQRADILEPATGNVLYRVGVAQPSDIERAAASARAVQVAWAALGFERKSTVFRKAAQLLEQHTSDVVGWITRETGSTVPKAHFEVSVTIRCLYEAASMPSQPNGLTLPSNEGRLSFARRLPLGVIGVITPFNFPLYLAMRAVAPALAVGNSVVLKPDLRTPVAGGFLLARLFEQAGLPQGLLHVLPGGADAGEALCTDSHIAMIQFTGSTATEISSSRARIKEPGDNKSVRPRAAGNPAFGVGRCKAQRANC
jgi:benzaldehyde dehydrogenase (NAD)